MSMLSSFFKGKSSTVNQEAMQTKEQKDAMDMLLNFAKTGKVGDFTAGEQYGGELGNYDVSNLEQTGQDKLMGRLTGTGNETFNAGKDEIINLLKTDKYDPYNEKGVYSGFKKNVLRQSGEASDRLNRDMAITGDLFSTTQGKEQGLLQERTSDQLTNKMAELYDTFTQRKIEGASTAANMGIAENSMGTQNINMSQEFGKLQRMMEDAKAKDKYAEWNRSRGENMTMLDTAKTLFNKNVPFGVKSYTTKSASPFSTLLNSVLKGAGNKFGSDFIDQLGTKTSARGAFFDAGDKGGTAVGGIRGYLNS